MNDDIRIETRVKLQEYFLGGENSPIDLVPGTRGLVIDLVNNHFDQLTSLVNVIELMALRVSAEEREKFHV